MPSTSLSHYRLVAIVFDSQSKDLSLGYPWDTIQVAVLLTWILRFKRYESTCRCGHLV